VIGFDTQHKQHIDKKNLLQYIAPQDLKAFGLIPEIVGRLPILTYLEPLDRSALRSILIEPHNAITKQYQKLMAMDGITLTFTDEALDYIVDKAIEFKLGARGLRALVETIMMDYMFELPGQNKSELAITRELAQSKIEKANDLRLQNAV
jgi:ATP-dependent Clp protease ATP-binding subunit ClpX